MDIEEDIKKLNKYIELVLDKNYCDCNELNVICGKHCDGSKNVAYAIKNTLAEREEDKKKIEELEDRCKSHQKLLYEAAEVEKNSIPKQKVKEILIEIQEEYNKLDKEIDKQIKDKNKDYYKCKENIAIMQTLAYCRDKLEELLEDK